MNNYCLWCCQSDDYQIPLLASPPPNSQSLLCSHCNRPILLVDVDLASSVAQKSRKTIYEWIRLGKVKTVRLADDRLLIYYNSLFRPPPEPDDQDS